MEQSALIERFLRYVKIDTRSDDESDTHPSTAKQRNLTDLLSKELEELGLTVDYDVEHCYIYCKIKGRGDLPAIGFISHMDTSPDASGKHVKASIVKAEEREYIDPRYAGQDVIVTDTTTLLGADDKAGIAEIVTAMEYLIQHPEIKHGKIRIGFTPDEEIGCGADHFDVKAFGADFAYTMDGGAIGELEFENFNAAACKIHVHGLNVHPGSAYHKMVNSMRIAYQLAVMLPRWETPEHTQGYEGFYHLIGMNGTVEETTLSYIIRDHDRARFESRKREIEHLVRKVNREFGEGTVEIEMRDQYYNMREKIEPVMHIIDLAKEAMESIGVTPVVKPIRGGTDGARLSFEGLPCPNIFAGGENFHSRYEYLPIPSMEKACQVILQIAQKTCK